MLPAPIEPMPTDAMLPGEMVNICAALQAVAGHVIVDLPSLFNDYVLAMLEAADEVLLVGSMDIPSIKNLKIGIQSLDLNAIAGPKLRLVLNHANAKVKLDVKEIERVLGLSADFPVPDDIAVPISVNAGRPVVSIYERVRSDDTHFLLRPGHEDTTVERVIETLDSYIVVEKHGRDVERVVEETDPRSE